MLQTELQIASVQETLAAPIQEVFSSIQGEGVYVGRRQIFVRFAHCHLKCAYCDTPMTSVDGLCHIEATPGHGKNDAYDNPVSVETLLNILEDLLPQANHHSISFTGGEPLLYHRFLKELFPQVQAKTKTYLETSATQPEFLKEILPWTDVIAMDIKLPSTTGESARFEEHTAFYELAKSNANTKLFIKLVFSGNTNEKELQAVEKIVSDRNTPIILQPVTSLDDQQVHVSPADIFRVEKYLTQIFSDVRVIPQTHKMLKVL